MKREGAPELGMFQIAVLVLTVFVLAALGIELVVAVPAEVHRIVGWVDNAVCALFFTDFVIRFRRASSKAAFMKWGWIDLLASVPEVEVLRWGRVFRVVRIVQLVRSIRSIRALFAIIYQSRARGGAASVALISFVTISIASIGILLAEHNSGGSIRTAEDALWWSVTTVTTVGYGDTFPVTAAGRAIAGVLMITGVGLFGTLSGLMATVVLGRNEPASAAPTAHTEIVDELRSLRSEIAALRKDRTPDRSDRESQT